MINYQNYFFEEMKQFLINETGDEEWLHEPDLVIWDQDIYRCIVRRIAGFGGGYLCGYVSFSEEITKLFYQHRRYYSDHILCHGGITLDDILETKPEVEILPNLLGDISTNIKYRMIGFDCNRNRDLNPTFLYTTNPGIYRNVEFMKKDIQLIIRQLEELRNDLST